MNNEGWNLPKRHILSVSELTRNIKEILEETFPLVWVSGEISNLRRPVSGHQYFTLKDTHTQIGAVLFKGQARNLKFELADGQTVTVMGRINVYEARGTYQIIVEYAEPGGVGALQLAFEQLRDRLAAEGLFDDKRKKAIPLLPQKIAVVTSPSGAAIKDILQITGRRFTNMPVEIVPVRVQGEESQEEIVSALRLLNFRQSADVIIVARGGGSLEDLQAFNSEAVARAIFSSDIPVVSGVGHQSDYTISDFVADLRAPTPSAAAELVVPEKGVLLERIVKSENVLKRSVVGQIEACTERIKHLSRGLSHSRILLGDWQLKLDDLMARMEKACVAFLRRYRDAVNVTDKLLVRHNPQCVINEVKRLLEDYRKRAQFATINLLRSGKANLETASGKLSVLNPLAVLDRGYSITRTFPGLSIVKDVGQIEIGQQVAVTVSKGEMVCRVERK